MNTIKYIDKLIAAEDIIGKPAESFYAVSIYNYCINMQGTYANNFDVALKFKDLATISSSGYVEIKIESAVGEISITLTP